jgi:hypothetical protein
MGGNLAQEVLSEVLPYLEALETKNSAMLQLLKDKGLITDEQFAPYLEQAGNVSSVKWLAARIRIEHLLLPMARETEVSDAAKKDEQQQGAKPAAEAKAERTVETAQVKNTERDSEKTGAEAADEETAESNNQPGSGQSSRGTPARNDEKDVDDRQGNKKNVASEAESDRSPSTHAEEANKKAS